MFIPGSPLHWPKSKFLVVRNSFRNRWSSRVDGFPVFVLVVDISFTEDLNIFFQRLGVGTTVFGRPFYCLGSSLSCLKTPIILTKESIHRDSLARRKKSGSTPTTWRMRTGFPWAFYESLFFTRWREGGNFSPWTGMPLLYQAIFRHLTTRKEGRDQIPRHPTSLTMIYFFQEIF